MHMTRQHFEFIAGVLRDLRPRKAQQTTQWAMTCEAFADALAKTNPNFNVARFLDACRNV